MEDRRQETPAPTPAAEKAAEKGPEELDLDLERIEIEGQLKEGFSGQEM